MGKMLIGGGDDPCHKFSPHTLVSVTNKGDLLVANNRKIGVRIVVEGRHICKNVCESMNWMMVERVSIDRFI